MATVRKRGNAYQIDYFDPTGKRIRKTYKRRKDAEAELGKRVSLIAEKRYLDVKKDYLSTLKDLLKVYKENFSHQRSFDNWKALCLKNFEAYFGEDTRLSNIRYVDLEGYRNHLRQKPTHKKTIRTVASINREISCLHHVFQKGVEWEMVERSPFERGKTLLQKENNQRLKFLTEEEIPKLIEACPAHLRRIVICALNTGMRKTEILSLKWSQVREGFIYLQKTKTDEPRQIPINDTLEKLFKEIRKGQKLGTESVFTYVNVGQGRKKKSPLSVVQNVESLPVKNIKTSFTSAVKRAGLSDFRPHDLRHTFASHMIMRGASLKELQELLGHKTMTMTLRYAHLSQEHKKMAVNLLNGLTTPKDGVTNCHNDQEVKEKGSAATG
jgi:integrase